ncbi:MAG: hypothetical protein U0746_11185 [Gemmataceae bacterium]
MATDLAPAPTAPSRRGLFRLDDLLGFLGKYLPLHLQVLLLALIAWGVVGTDLGLDDLVWDDRGDVQFLNGLAVGGLLAQILFLRFVLHRRTTRRHPDTDDPAPGLVGTIGTLWPALVLAFAGRRLVTVSDAELPGGPWAIAVFAGSLVGAALVGLGLWARWGRGRKACQTRHALVTLAIWELLIASALAAAFFMHWPLPVGMLTTALLLAALVAIGECGPRHAVQAWPPFRWLLFGDRPPDDDVVTTRFARLSLVALAVGLVVWAAAGRLLLGSAFLGIAAGGIAAVILLGVGEALGLGASTQVRALLREIVGVIDGKVRPVDEGLHAYAALAFLPLVVATGSAHAAFQAGHVIPPIVVLCVLFALFNAAFGFVAYHLRDVDHVLVLGLIALLFWANYGNPYKLSFPGLDYAPTRLVAIDTDGTTDHYRTLVGDPPRDIGLIPGEEPLKAMCERWQRAHPDRPGAKPRLVVVSLSGGGIRAACWAAAVLDGLERHLPTFRDRIRLCVGASGGMVGAAYYAADFERPHGIGDPSAVDCLAHDFLSPAVQAMLLHDSAHFFLHEQTEFDRGRALEDAWYATALAPDGSSPLARPLRDLAARERTGERPSLIFTPMLVEDARRLIVSNLDMHEITEAHADRLSPETNLTSPRQSRLLSLSALEFGRLFPNAAQFKVGTAARMNASFPFVSPGVSLPTMPPRRVVDAGYFDNYGVNVAALWLHRHREAVRLYTSGVAVVEVRAYRTGYARRYVQNAENEMAAPDGVMVSRDQMKRPPEPWLSALAGLSTPLEGLLSSYARGQLYRDDELLDLIGESFNSHPPEPGRASGDAFFTTVAFECGTDAALSWKLSAKELADIKASFATETGKLSPQVERQVKRLAWWLGPRGDGPDRAKPHISPRRELTSGEEAEKR